MALFTYTTNHPTHSQKKEKGLFNSLRLRKKINIFSGEEILTWTLTDIFPENQNRGSIITKR